ncbi:MAG TPA: hypothetical protein VFW87_13480 [Pirellulales bacterium]|nr:hypothetical protein [Pirellulales bacterium]
MATATSASDSQQHFTLAVIGAPAALGTGEVSCGEQGLCSCRQQLGSASSAAFDPQQQRPVCATAPVFEQRGTFPQTGAAATQVATSTSPDDRASLENMGKLATERFWYRNAALFSAIATGKVKQLCLTRTNWRPTPGAPVDYASRSTARTLPSRNSK